MTWAAVIRALTKLWLGDFCFLFFLNVFFLFVFICSFECFCLFSFFVFSFLYMFVRLPGQHRAVSGAPNLNFNPGIEAPRLKQFDLKRRDLAAPLYATVIHHNLLPASNVLHRSVKCSMP